MTKNQTVRTIAVALAAITTTGLLPIAAQAQGRHHEAEQRQKTKNEWRNLALAAGGLTAFGLIKKDPTISFIGAAGALYSLDRYEKDRKSQDSAARARASFFDKQYFYRDGKRYDRQIVTKNGQRYYRFNRH